jgi:hypothetical protein
MWVRYENGRRQDETGRLRHRYGLPSPCHQKQVESRSSGGESARKECRPAERHLHSEIQRLTANRRETACERWAKSRNCATCSASTCRSKRNTATISGTHGDFSRSFKYQAPVRRVSFERYPALQFAFLALLVCAAIAIPSGMLAAAAARRPTARSEGVLSE